MTTKTQRLEIPARDLRKGDRLVTFDWIVDTATEMPGGSGPFISVTGRTDKGHTAGTAFRPELRILIDRPDPPVQPGVPRQALLDLVERWERLATRNAEERNRLQDDAFNRPKRFQLQAVAGTYADCAAELRKLVEPAPAPVTPVEQTCGEGPHGQPCGQPVIDGVCPDHGEVGP